jgi:type IV pilus assembly protein PilM
LTSLAKPAGLSSQFYKMRLVRRVDRWLHTMPHPSLVVEIAADHIAAARWGSARGHLDALGVEALPAGAVMPSPIETNVTQPDAVRSALRRVFSRVALRGAPLALLVPDPVVRVFILPFESFPRRSEEALPLLRWRLKKSVPFDVDETVISWMRQSGRNDTLEVIAAVARQQIVREYEEVVRSLGGHAGVVISSTLAATPLLEERGATLLVRLSAKTMTTVIVHGSTLCVYRSTEMSADAALLDPQAMLDEVFPAVAYYQDTWGATVDRARLAGFGGREETFLSALAEELNVAVAPLDEAEHARGLDGAARDLIPHGLDSLVGWMMNRGS